jgi:hypothetical protein
MVNGSSILLCVTIFVIHKQCFLRAHCSIVTVSGKITIFKTKTKVEKYVIFCHMLLN